MSSFGKPPTTRHVYGHNRPALASEGSRLIQYICGSSSLNLSIYTLRLPGARLYVVNSSSLITSVQRQSKVLALPPIEAVGAANVCDFSQTMRDILNTNTHGEEGPWGYSMTFYKAIHTPLAPGPRS